MDDFSFLMVPGLGGSGAEHWQSLWQGEFADARTVEQMDWDRPDIEAWVAVLDRYVEGCRKPVVLVAHSLGCALVAHWAGRVLRGQIETPSAPIAAAMLVAPGDVDREPPKLEAVRPFAPMPLARIAFPSIVVASTDDPFVTAERSAQFASSWDSEFVSVGPMGHISGDSGCGPWPHGMEILTEFLRQQSAPRQ
jgi:predicted alpha/beta hydrolase family esterase